VVGLIVQGTPTGDAWSYGLRRRIGLSPADRRLEEDPDAWRRGSLHRRFIEVWEIGPGAQESVRRPEHLFIQPEVVGVAFGSSPESVHPSDHVGETFGIPSTSLTIPSVLHPEGLRFPGVLLGCCYYHQDLH